MTKLLHIGLGKCGSTFLQRQIFPIIAERLETNYINLYNNDFVKIDKNKIKFNALENIKDFEKYLPNKFIISNEGLFSKDLVFSEIYRSFDYIKNNFSGVEIYLDTSQKTYKFFEKFGFVVEKISKNGYGVGLDRYDMFLK